MAPDEVSAEIRSPEVVAAVLLLGLFGTFAVLLRRPRIFLAAVSLMTGLYVLYLFVRLVVAVETMAYEE